MKKSFILSLLINAVFAISSVEEQRKHHVSTSLNVRYPEELKINLKNNEEGYEHTDALFGLPFLHNRTIIGSLYYMTPNFDINKNSYNGCSGYSTSLTSKELQTQTAIYLVDRGGCSFIDKASLAQAQGAEGIIIPNDECLSTDITFFKDELGLSESEIETLCCKQDFVRSENCAADTSLAYQYLPFMTTSSKGQALSINIPAMLINYRDSLQFKVCLCKFQQSLEKNNFCSPKSDVMKKVF